MKLNAAKGGEGGEAVVDAAISSHKENQAYSVVYSDKLDSALAIKSDKHSEQYGYEVIAEISKDY